MSEDNEPRQFTQVIAEIRGLDLELTDKLAEVAAAVDLHGKAGELVLKLKVKRAGDGLEICPTVNAKTPEYEKDAAFFFVGDGGSLLRNPPNQPSIFDEETQP